MFGKISKNSTITIGIITSIFVILAVFCTLLEDYSLCGNSDFVEVDSPNRNYTAISYLRGCGVTSGGYTHVEIRWNWLGGIISKEVAGFDGESSTEFYWKNDDELLIKTSMIPNRTENYKPVGILVIVEKKD
jgi:hypothetical protein